MSDKVRRKLLARRIYLEDLEYVREKGRVIKRRGRYIELHVGGRKKPLVVIFWELENELDTRTAYRKRGN